MITSKEDTASDNSRAIEFLGRHYEVFRNGDIYRCAFVDPRGGKLKRKKLQPTKAKSGHTYLTVGLGNAKMKMYVHRIIAEAFICDPRDINKLTVDHIDGNPSNNSVDNLRFLTHAENHRAYVSVWSGGTSKFRGVCWDSRRKCWIAYITNEGKIQQLGRFESEIDAARAYNKRAIQIGFFKEALNKIEGLRQVKWQGGKKS